jgi:thiamine monophosphate synthase
VRQADIELCAAREQLSIPVVAIEGINAENSAAALRKHNHDHQLSRGEARDEQ